MAFKIHGARKGKITKESRATARQAVKAATSRAANGYQVSVWHDAKIVMICGPENKLHDRSGKRKHWCRITDPGFKPPGKLNIRRKPARWRR